MAIRIHVSVVSGKASTVFAQAARAIEPGARAFARSTAIAGPESPACARGRFTIVRVRRSTVATHATSFPAYPPPAQMQLDARETHRQRRLM